MHWGHAISKDLIKWEHLPIALKPDETGMVFSGSAVVDKNDTSGLLGEDGGLVAVFTNTPCEHEKDHKLQYQSLAYSIDRGRTWIKYEGNPVLENPGIKDFRDPKIVWYEPKKMDHGACLWEPRTILRVDRS